MLYEYYDRIERTAARNELANKEETRQEEEKDKDSQDWADQMEHEELEAAKAQTSTPAPANPEEVKPVGDPTKDPENIKWMEEQMKIHKQQFGQSFGEDVELDFNE